MTDAVTFYNLYGMTRGEYFEDPPMPDLQSQLDTLRRIQADVIADNITLRNEIKRLRKALEPFAAEFDEWENKHSHDFYLNDEPTQDCNRAQFTMSDLRTAANLVNGE